ncbi:PREDICTED: coiled-coil domain-containing protein 6 [Chinchilla lanigera]|uniref:coiled-coil domain-containing protein 6 n=1 Tax=Chinchilla lanigera TaxID=34839 RepID=UPI0006988B6B|nr:PREDICTED: coiled-coil domain-containing protein 6 [Chinchilla lanigera]
MGGAQSRERSILRRLGQGGGGNQREGYVNLQEKQLKSIWIKEVNVICEEEATVQVNFLVLCWASCGWLLLAVQPHASSRCAACELLFVGATRRTPGESPGSSGSPTEQKAFHTSSSLCRVIFLQGVQCEAGGPSMSSRPAVADTACAIYPVHLSHTGFALSKVVGPTSQLCGTEQCEFQVATWCYEAGNLAFVAGMAGDTCAPMLLSEAFIKLGFASLALQKEKETLAVNYEKEEEFLTNELSRKLMQLQHEKAELEQHLEQEQEFQVNKLMKKIKKLENDTISKQLTLEQLRREKIDLENTLEQEQEALVNRLWKRMDKLEAEKRILQEKLDQPVSAPPSPRDISMEIDSPENMMRHIRFLKNEVERLKKQLRAAQLQHSEKMAQYLEEERHMREENLRLQRKLQREMERREALCRQLSESESSLEMDDERYFNEMSAQGLRPRTVSSPIPYTPSPSSSRPISPGLSYASHTVGFTPPTSLTRAGVSYYNSPGLHVQHMGASHGITRPSPRRSNSPDKFKRPTPPPSPNTQTPVQPPPPPPPPPMQPTVPSAATSQPAPSQHSVHPSSQP